MKWFRVLKKLFFFNLGVVFFFFQLYAKKNRYQRYYCQYANFLNALKTLYNFDHLTTVY